MGRIYASSDWHGCGTVARKVFKYLQPDDKLYFLGDAIDRGPDGINIMDLLLSDPRVVYIKGNHEQLMEKAVPRMLNINTIWHYDTDISDWYDLNGGSKTWESLANKPEEEIMSYIETIKHMSVREKYHSKNGHTVILEHAGHSPFIPRRYSHDPLWDRQHFHDNWNPDNIPIGNVTYLVHGHTPVQYLRLMYGYKDSTPLTKEEYMYKYSWYEDKNYLIPKIIRYCDGHKFDIDMCTIVSRRIALLDLDTFEEVYIDED